MSHALLFALSHIIECVVAYYFFESLFNSNKSSINKFFTYIISYTFLFSIMFTKSSAIILSSNILIIYLLIHYIYCVSRKTALFYSFIITVFISCTEILAALIIDTSTYNYYNCDVTTTQCLAFIISKFIYVLSILMYLYFRSKKNNSISIIPIYLLGVFGVLTIQIFVFSTLMIMNPFNIFEKTLIVIGTTSIIILLFIVLWLKTYIQKKQDKILKIEYALQQEKLSKDYFDTIHEQNESRNILVHDIKNHIIFIKELFDQKKYDEANEYIQQLSELPALKKNVNLTSSQNLNILLNVYVKRCEDKHIRFSVDADGYEDFLNPTHLTALFCNLLDNAYEAASACTDAFIDVTLRYDNITKIAKITIKNTCHTAPIMDSDNLFYSSKRNYKRHGFGMTSIERIVNLYEGNYHSYYEESEKCFYSVILLCRKELADEYSNM